MDKDGLYLLPKKTPVASVDEQFMEKALQVVEKHLTDKSFDMDSFGKAMGMSRLQLYRNLKSLEFRRLILQHNL